MTAPFDLPPDFLSDTIAEPAPGPWPDPASQPGAAPTPVPGSGSAGRFLWFLIGGTLAAFLIGYGALVLVNLLAWETSDEPLALDGLGSLDHVERIRIDADSGSVRVSANDDGGIRGELRLQHDLFRPDHQARVDGDTLVLESDCPVFGTMFCGVDYELSVPSDMVLTVDSSGGDVTVIGAGAAVDLHSSGGGITVIDVAGPVTVDSSGGGIEVVDSGGDLEAHSSGGSVDIAGSTAERADVSSSGGGVSISFDQAPMTVLADSSGGGVTVRLPADDSIAYDVDASSSGGGTTVDVRTDSTAERTIDATSSGGSVDVVYRDTND